MSEDEIKIAVEGAFQPLRCDAEIWDFGEKLKFCVYDQENCVYKVASCPLNLVRDKSDLESFLRDRRADVQNKGFTLDPWTLA
jgi:hypothetical protein